MIKLTTAGESHGEYMVGILQGVPSGLKIDFDFIKEKLFLRRKGFGRSERMNIEKDEFEIFGGVDERNITTGAPIGFRVLNFDSMINKTKRESQIPRPGHVDYSGSIKYNFENFYLPSERRSGRLTTLDTIAGAICEMLLNELNINIYFSVLSIGKVKINDDILNRIDEIFEDIKKSTLFVPNLDIENRMINEIELARSRGDTLGGSGVVVIKNFPPGVGDYNEFQNNLDGILAQTVMSVPSVKGVEIGEGILGSSLFGSEFLDEFYISKDKIKRKTNRSGGIEGGVSNGENIIIKFYSKPIPTLLKGIKSIDFKNYIEIETKYVRSDIVAVPAITLVVSNRVSLVLANELKKKFGGDTIKDLKENLNNYLKSRRRFWQK